MHAASGHLVKKVTVALAALASAVLAGCTNSGSDNPSLRQPSSTAPASGSPGPPGPAVTIGRVNGIPVPELVGHPAADAALVALGRNLHGSCTVTTLRDDPRLASFDWSCRPDGFTAVTFALAGDRHLSLSVVLTGDYRGYLSSTGAAQLVAQGASNPAATA